MRPSNTNTHISGQPCKQMMIEVLKHYFRLTIFSALKVVKTNSET